jgi:tRNA threonylcarbamoyladenosine biosynthesis protein TsaE
MRLVASNLLDIKKVAQTIIGDLNTNKIILLNGEMGVGKTTLVKEITKLFGVTENVSSPTFSIINEYYGDEIIYHFDFYRIEDEEEAYDFGVEEYFDSGKLCLVEWPEKISTLLPPLNLCLEVKITIENNIRIYTF